MKNHILKGEKSHCTRTLIVIISYLNRDIKDTIMNSITEKHTEKKLGAGSSQDFTSQNDSQPKKQYTSTRYRDVHGRDYGPELLEAHIIALLGKALS